MQKGYKYRIYITKGQRRILDQQLAECRWLYNRTLGTRKQAWDNEHLSIGWHETSRMIPIWKDEKPSITCVHSQVLQNVVKRVDLAFEYFFRQVREGAKEPGYPRFKSFGRYDSMTYPQYGNGVRIDGNRLILSKVGAVHVVLHRPIEGTPKTATLTRDGLNKWYASFSCVVDPQRLPEVDEEVGVDVGLLHFATLSNGEQIENPRFYRTDEKDRARVQSRKDIAKNKQDWPENNKQKKVLAQIDARITNRRKDFAHKQSRKLINRFQTIVFEQLAPREMGKSSGMRKSILDVAWSQFITMTVSKAAEAGRHVILVDPRNTSKICSSCGELVDKKLSDRIHTCPYCGLVMDRDMNAAINILQRGLHVLQT